MRLRRIAAVVGIAALALGMSACGKDSDDSAKGTGDKCAYSGLTFTPAGDVNLQDSATWKRAKERGHLIVGVKADQPNLGYKDADGKRCGFDVEVSQYVAAKLGFDPSKTEYKEIPSKGREDVVKQGQIDYYVGTYSITDKRKGLGVGFAGPYFVSGQGLLVRKDDDSITGKDSLKGKKVCSATGSTSVQRIRDEQLTDAGNIVEFDTYSQCVSQLLDKKVDAVTTDDAILKGYAAQRPDKLKVVGNPFSVEKYGVGMQSTDTALREAINKAIEASVTDGNWQKMYDATLGQSGSSATPVSVERY